MIRLTSCELEPHQDYVAEHQRPKRRCRQRNHVRRIVVSKSLPMFMVGFKSAGRYTSLPVETRTTSQSGVELCEVSSENRLVRKRFLENKPVSCHDLQCSSQGFGRVPRIRSRCKRYKSTVIPPSRSSNNHAIIRLSVHLRSALLDSSTSFTCLYLGY
jgi:hypothetical protein